MFGAWNPVAAAQTYEEPLPIPTGATSQVALSQSNTLATCTPPAYFQPNPTVWTVSTSEVQLGGLPAADVMPAAGHLVSVTVPSNMQPGQGFFISWTGNTACVSFNGIMYFTVSAAPTAPPAPPPTARPSPSVPEPAACETARSLHAQFNALTAQIGTHRSLQTAALNAAAAANQKAFEAFGGGWISKMFDFAKTATSPKAFAAAVAKFAEQAGPHVEYAIKTNPQLKQLLIDHYRNVPVSALPPGTVNAPPTAVVKIPKKVAAQRAAQTLASIAPVAKDAIRFGGAAASGASAGFQLEGWLYYSLTLQKLYEARTHGAAADRLAARQRELLAKEKQATLACQQARGDPKAGATALVRRKLARPVPRAVSTIYRSLPRIRPVLRFHVERGGALTTARASTLTRLLAAQGRAIVLMDALQSALKRSRLAADAKDVKAEKLQKRFIRKVAPKLAGLLRTQVGLNKRAQRALVSAKRGVLSYEIAQPGTFAKIMHTLGPPRPLVSYVRLLRLPAPMITSTWNTKPQAGSVRIDLTADIASFDALRHLTRSANAFAELAR